MPNETLSWIYPAAKLSKRGRSKGKVEELTVEDLEAVREGMKETVRLERRRGCRIDALNTGYKRITPLEELKEHRLISRNQYLAGEVYGRLYKYAHFIGKYKSGLNNLDGAWPPEIGMAAMSAIARAKAFIENRDAVEQADIALGWEQKPTNKELLLEALACLEVCYFGYSKKPFLRVLQ